MWAEDKNRKLTVDKFSFHAQCNGKYSVMHKFVGVLDNPRKIVKNYSCLINASPRGQESRKCGI